VCVSDGPKDNIEGTSELVMLREFADNMTSKPFSGRALHVTETRFKIFVSAE
jgi:hypothetical protein